MRFVNPSLLIWGSLLVVPIVLYLVRPRPKLVRVTTLAFFKNLSRAYQESSWLRRLKQLLSLLLSVLVIAAAAFALARLVISPPADALQTVVVLVDRSASMQADAEGGGTRLQRGLEQVRARLAGLPGSPSVILMAYDRRPEILLSRSHDGRAIDRALSQIAVRPTVGDSSRALLLATDLAAMDRPAVIWHITDHETDFVPAVQAMDESIKPDTEKLTNQKNAPLGALEEARPPEPPPGVKIERLVIGHPQPINAGITVLELRRMPQLHTDFEAFVQVQHALTEPLDAELEVSLDGTLIDLRKLALRPGESQRLLLPLKADAERDSLLSVRVKLVGDTLALDNTAFARLPRAKPLVVLWLSEAHDPFTELALTSLGPGYDVLVGKPDRWPPKEMPQVVIFDGWTPQQWPTDIPAVVVNPPASFGPVRVARLAGSGIPLERIRATNLSHPVLYGVANDRVSVVQTAVFDAGSLLEPLWLSVNAEPLLLAGQSKGQSLVVLGFEPAKSESLPLMASYPLLLGNAINWAAQKALGDETGHNQRTGDLIETPAGGEITWQVPLGDAKTRQEKVATAGRWYELDRIGPWQTSSGQSGTASLLSPSETRLEAGGSDAAFDASSTFAWLSGDLTVPLLWLVLGVLLGESWLFHRQAVY